MDEFASLYREVIAMLKEVFQTRNDVFLVTGSGSSAMEASILSVVEPGDKVITDKYYEEYCRIHGAQPIPIQVEMGDVIGPETIERIVRRESRVKAVALAQNDTAAGVTNVLKGIGDLLAESGTLLIVDAVSSLGGIELKVDEWGIDICSSASQKALSVPPGLAPIAVSEKAWSAIESRKTPIRSKYLNLLSYREAYSKNGHWHPTPFTPSTVLIRALFHSLKAILTEGLEAVFQRHARVAQAFRSAFKAAGFELLVRDERFASNTVTAVLWPDQYDYGRFWNTLYSRFGIMIGNPPVQWEAWPVFRGYFRIGHMGRTANADHVFTTLSAAEMSLKAISYPIEHGVMVRAAEEILS